MIMKVLEACHEETGRDDAGGRMEVDFGPQDVELMPLEVSVLTFAECVEWRDTEREEGHIQASSQLDMSPSARLR
jgi:hypothetical protein